MSRWNCGIVVCLHFLWLFGWKGKERTFEEAVWKMLTLIGLSFFFLALVWAFGSCKFKDISLLFVMQNWEVFR